jgi:hypothetical protein
MCGSATGLRKGAFACRRLKISPASQFWLSCTTTTRAICTRSFLESRHARVIPLSTAAAALHYLGFGSVDVVLAEQSVFGPARRTFVRAVRMLPKCVARRELNPEAEHESQGGGEGASDA